VPQQLRILQTIVGSTSLCTIAAQQQHTLLGSTAPVHGHEEHTAARILQGRAAEFLICDVRPGVWTSDLRKEWHKGNTECQAIATPCK
jgi:hypothetical protein